MPSLRNTPITDTVTTAAHFHVECPSKTLSESTQAVQKNGIFSSVEFFCYEPKNQDLQL